MGYLNSDTIVVDAILTKHGRRVLSGGNGLNISKFALSDDGVDYSLYNPDHPSGSVSYGQAITNLPQLEATPDDFTMMSYKLITLDRHTHVLPYIDLKSGVDHIKFLKDDQGVTKIIQPQTRNYSSTEMYEALLVNTNYVNMAGGSAVDISGVIGLQNSAQDIPQSVLQRGTEFHITPLVNSTGITQTTIIKFTGMTSGAHFNVQVSVAHNSDI